MGSVKPQIIGLTGGIGSGKSSVARLLREQGYAVIDLDEEVRVLTNTSIPIRKKIINLFGEAAFINGNLNKPMIRKAVFESSILRQKLEAIFHPEVWKSFSKKIKAIKAPYVFCEAPLLIESGLSEHCSFTILVTSFLKKRIARVKKRSGLSTREVERIILSQWPEKKKIPFAHYVIKNNGSLEALKKQIEEFLQFL